MICRTGLVAALLLVHIPSIAQRDDAKTTEKERNAQALETYTKEAPSQGAEKALEMYGVDAFPCEKDQADEQVHRACMGARRAYYEYYAAGLARRTKVYEWNNFSTRVIFVVVLFLVGVGIYFSWKQFFGMTLGPPVEGGESSDKERQLPITEFEAGLGGIKVKSPILGVILLTLSLAFFYLYLRYVYPVTEHF